MMKIVLTGLKSLELVEAEKPRSKKGFKLLKVLYCAICRTDAKMWNEGHRDLVFPRVLGHELVAEDDQGKRFVVWPGKSCGACFYCRAGRENLCEDMRITGFHDDGGFSTYVQVVEENLVPVADELASHIACFAEPVGCVLNAFEKLQIRPRERMIIYGGGTLGLITALVAMEKGAVPTIIEKNEEKIDKAAAFLSATGIECCKDTVASDFDIVLNACPDPIAFSLGLVKVRKGGRISLFSGLTKNDAVETNIINLAHYKEAEIHGAYGLKKSDIVEALPILQKNATAFAKLIEKILAPQSAPELMPEVLSGKALKYVLDFTGNLSGSPISGSNQPTLNLQAKPLSVIKFPVELSSSSAVTLDLNGFTPVHKEIIQEIRPLKETLGPKAQWKIDNKTKPLGALGKLEELAYRLSLIQNSLEPVIKRRGMLVFAGDHGVVEEGVSAYPAEVTGQMVDNFLDGGAAINVLCRHHNIDLRVVDMGVDKIFADHPALIRKKVRRGTRNFAVEAAMTAQEMVKAVQNGMDVFTEFNQKKKIDIIGLGEMGIGNTTSASAIISAITGITPSAVTSRGTGIDNKGLEHKVKVIEKALKFHDLDPENGFEILRKIGGFEIAGIVGAALVAAYNQTAIVLDGVISTAAGLIAYLINPDVKGYLISGHKSVETAQQAALSYIGLTPIIDLNMRLGEGTGAALTIDLADASCRIMREMASFDEAGVAQKK